MTVQFIDRPCGTGKTEGLLKSFQKGKRYFVVVNTREEVKRIIDDAVVSFVEPEEVRWIESSDDRTIQRSSKVLGLDELIEDGTNIVCTHALFDRVNMRDYDLFMYHVIIDEVFECVKHVSGPKASDFQEVYIQDGLATVDEEGKVSPTGKWLRIGDDAFAHKLLPDAIRGRLYVASDGFYVSVVPDSLFTENRSCTVMTYMAKGSLMAMYLDKRGIAYEIDTDPDADRLVRQRAKQKLVIDNMKISKGVKLGYAAQGKWFHDKQRKVGSSVKNLKYNHMNGIDPEKILVTCRKDVWDGKNGRSTFKEQGRLAKSKWCHKSTKGTNKYRDCTHAIHIFELNMNPSIAKYLGVDSDKEDLWRQSELIQWLFRTDIRNKESGEVHVWFADPTCRDLVDNWMSDTPIQ